MIKGLKYLLFLLLGTALCAQSEVTLPDSFHAEFKQTITSEQKKQIAYEGKISFSAPNYFKWSYTSPTKKEVCTDGKELLVVDHDLEQVSAYLIDKGLDLPEILKKAKLHRKSVYIANYKGKNYTIQVNSRGELSRVAYIDDLDNTVLIVFSKMKYGKKKIPESKLKCRYPDSYDQIRG
ncbi:MAG: LolA-like outer membrane lipoprotein chaperone [Campylobacterota bacterium]|nr:LolA-like outer membrane lipoprotein chaperone [Campylobacterota bacterium]